MGAFRPSVPIMLVEDDEGHLLLIRENLRSAGVINDIIEMHNGQEALDYLSHRGAYREAAHDPLPGLILLDIKMPIVDGFAFLEQVKADPRLRGIPVLMMTSTDDPREINRSYRLGASGYIVKPVRYEEFQQRVQALGLFLDMVRFPTEQTSAS